MKDVKEEVVMECMKKICKYYKIDDSIIIEYIENIRKVK